MMTSLRGLWPPLTRLPPERSNMILKPQRTSPRHLLTLLVQDLHVVRNIVAIWRELKVKLSLSTLPCTTQYHNVGKLTLLNK